MKFQKLITLIVLYLILKTCYSQAGYEFMFYSGKDKNIFSNFKSQAVIAYFSFPLKKVNDKTVIYIRQGIRYEKNVFLDNTIIQRSNNQNSFHIDSNASNIYRNKVFKTGNDFNIGSINLFIKAANLLSKEKYIYFGYGLGYEYVINGVYRRTFENNGEQQIIEKFMSNEFFGVNRHKLILNANINYKFLGFYINLGLSQMFNKSENLKVNTHSIGIVLSLNEFKRGVF
jgi:hypothetical protein